MKKIFFFSVLLLFALCVNNFVKAGITKDNILVVYMTSSPAVANYYKTQRGLSDAQLLGVTPTTHTFGRFMTYSNYKTEVEEPVLAKVAELENTGLTIQVILITRPMPTGVTKGGDYFGPEGSQTKWASLDSELAASLRGSGGGGYMLNPYFQSGPFFKEFNKNVYNMFLVMRLDGPSDETAEQLVDRAKRVEANNYNLTGKGYFDRWQNYGMDTSIEFAYNIFVNEGNTSFLDTSTSLMTQENYGGDNALFYWGWYDGPNQHYADNGSWFKWKDGSIGVSVVSGGTTYFVTFNGFWVANMINDGITGTQGSVSEGTTIAYSQPHLLLQMMLKGATYAEACYASNYTISWMQIFVGDPLFRWTDQSTLIPTPNPTVTAEANGPYSVEEGSPITFQGNATGSNPISKYEWDLNGDTVFETDEQNPSKTYDDDLSITVMFRVTDSTNATDIDTASLTVTNANPTISGFTIDTTDVNPGNSVTISANYADPGILDTHTVQVDWGEGAGIETTAVSGGSFSLSHTYGSTGTYPATLRVQDDDGGLSEVQQFTVIVNSPPIANAHGDYIVDEGSPITFSATASDPDNDESFFYQWDLNDDAIFETNEQNPTKTYFDNALFSIVLRVTDHGGLTDNDSALLTVNNVSPSIISFAIDSDNILAGETITITSNYTDPGLLDTHEAIIHWGDSPDAETVAVSSHPFVIHHIYTTAGSFNADLTIRDDDNGYSAPQAFSITVKPLPKPQIALAGFGLIAINWDTQTGKTYVLEYSDGDNDGALTPQAVFTEIPESLVTELSNPADGEMYVDDIYANPPLKSWRYYRVKIFKN